MVSAFGGALDFMNKVGVFDVVLPFLLVFTLIFAFLEKTKVFGSHLVDTTIEVLQLLEHRHPTP